MRYIGIGQMNENWYAVLMMLLILGIILGLGLWANCVLLDEICSKN